MMESVRRRVVTALIAGLVAWLSPEVASAVDVPTVYDNMHMFPVGSRAAGMGGAYTALGCDEAALHYNPAALGCAGSSRLELSASAYVLQHFSVPNAFGEDQNINALTYSAVPTIVGGVRVLRDPDDAFGSGRVVLGFNISLPQSLVLSVEPAQQDEPNYIVANVRDQITAADAGVGWQINRHVSIGASIGGVLRTFEGRFESMLSDPFTIPCLVGDCRSFVLSSTTEESLAIGLRGRLGVRVTPTPELSLGLAVTSPSIDVWGKAGIVDSAGFAIGDPATGDVIYSPIPVRLEGKSDASMPLRIALGVAYRWPRVALSLDGSVNFPHRARSAYDLRQIDYDGIPPLDDDLVDESEVFSVHTWQPNVNLGAEFAVVEDVVIDVGAFTDLSSVSNEDIAERDADRVHMFGGTLALGLLGKQTRGWFGMSFEFGRAGTNVAEGELNLNNVLIDGLDLSGRSTVTRWTLAGFIGSNYSFHDEDDAEAETPSEDEEP
ncbi:MAG TPA: hypothetical protein ENK57_18365 [Polyangiaceae bacterium]|nr:hypothetical protein [Polyangiaceae bacterium]